MVGSVEAGDRGGIVGAGLVCVCLAGISFVVTNARVAEILGEDEDRLYELSMGLDPEDGCLWVYDIDEREVQAFTPYGIECLQQIIADERADGRAPKPKEKP